MKWINFLTILIMFLSVSTKTIPKLGRCPDAAGLIGICVEKCFDDSSCTGSQKCCSNGCGHVCKDPTINIQQISNSTTTLKPATTTTRKATTTATRKPAAPKPGNCPIPKPGLYGICVEDCFDDSSCTGLEKCCSNGCGHVCKNPTTTTTRKPATSTTRKPTTAATRKPTATTTQKATTTPRKATGVFGK